MAIVADLFPLEVRGRVMGTIQTAFAASQVMGLPLGVFLSNHWGWHAPFIMILVVGVPAGLLIAARLQPIVEHLKVPSKRDPVRHLVATVSEGRYLRTFLATMMLATGGFMLMPFGSAFTVEQPRHPAREAARDLHGHGRGDAGGGAAARQARRHDRQVQALRHRVGWRARRSSPSTATWGGRRSRR